MYTYNLYKCIHCKLLSDTKALISYYEVFKIFKNMVFNGIIL